MTAIAGPAKPDGSNDDGLVELLRVGPIGGVDPTTAPPFVAPTNVIAASNITPNTSYGAFATALGRANGLAANLAGTVTGMWCMSVPGQPDTYIFALTNLAGTQGQLWSSTLGGMPTQLTIPTLPSSGNTYFTPNLPTYFCQLGQWVFMTNGTDTPVKITSALLVTQWGIIKPATAPSLAATGGGGMTPNGVYYYCVTFGTATQESSQGTISAPVVLANTPSTVSSTITGTGAVGDIYSVTINSGSIHATAYTPPSTIAATPAQIAAMLVAAVSANPPLGLAASAVGATITWSWLTGLNSGSISNNDALASGSTAAWSGGTPSGGSVQSAVNLTAIPVSTDTQVTERNIYRLGGALGQWRLVGTLNDNTTTTFTDGLADNAVTGQSLTIFRDPPPAFNYICAHQNCVFGFGTPTDSGSLWFSNYNEPWGFNSDTGFLECNSTTLDDGAVGLASLGSVLLCFKKRTTFLCYGNTPLTFQTYFAFGVGCTSAPSITAAFGWVWWMSRQGIYFYNGSGFDPVANNISSGRFQVSNIKKFLDSLALADRAAACGFIYDSMPHISFPTQNITYFYDLRSQQWFSLPYACTVAVFSVENQQQVVAANSAVAGEVDEWFAGGTDLGNAITAMITSRRAHAERIEAMKEAKFLVIDAPNQSGLTAVATIIANPGANQTNIGTLNYNLGAGGPQHVQDVAKNEFMAVEVELSITSNTQAFVEQISLWGSFLRALPETMNDGA